MEALDAVSEWTRSYRHREDEHKATLTARDGLLRANVDGRELVAEYEWVSEGVLHLRLGGRHVFCHVSGRGDERFVTVGGRTYVLQVPREGRAGRRAGAEEGGLAAPMPGRVLKLSVEVGETVEKGRTLLILEAMKMEHEIRAPHAGRVLRVACRQGEMVQPGVPLLELGPLEEEAPPALPPGP